MDCAGVSLQAHHGIWFSYLPTAAVGRRKLVAQREGNEASSPSTSFLLVPSFYEQICSLDVLQNK